MLRIAAAAVSQKNVSGLSQSASVGFQSNRNDITGIAQLVSSAT
jgi:hypothetical protein